MQRYFSARNLAQYNKLASGTLSAVERKVIFDGLVKQQAAIRDRCNSGFEDAADVKVRRP